jgi:hypothetical protein
LTPHPPQVNDALSDKFWCTNRGILNGTVTDLLEADDEFGPSAANVTETALVDVLHTDVSFVACMENVRAPRERERGREDPVGSGKGPCLQTTPLATRGCQTCPFVLDSDVVGLACYEACMVWLHSPCAGVALWYVAG